MREFRTSGSMGGECEQSARLPDLLIPGFVRRLSFVKVVSDLLPAYPWGARRIPSALLRA